MKGCAQTTLDAQVHAFRTRRLDGEFPDGTFDLKPIDSGISGRDFAEFGTVRPFAIAVLTANPTAILSDMGNRLKAEPAPSRSVTFFRWTTTYIHGVSTRAVDNLAEALGVGHPRRHP